ncbi:hypothetical protein J6590_030645 [Homalodisca vitripennis]|nr:hypothetical protein J6590_030645 [Homalodisca vitripennis]
MFCGIWKRKPASKREKLTVTYYGRRPRARFWPRGLLRPPALNTILTTGAYYGCRP